MLCPPCTTESLPLTITASLAEPTLRAPIYISRPTTVKSQNTTRTIMTRNMDAAAAATLLRSRKRDGVSKAGERRILDELAAECEVWLIVSVVPKLLWRFESMARSSILFDTKTDRQLAKPIRRLRFEFLRASKASPKPSDWLASCLPLLVPKRIQRQRTSC